MGCKLPGSGFPANLRGESGEFCSSLAAVFEGKKRERTDVLGLPNEIDLPESGVELERPQQIRQT